MTGHVQHGGAFHYTGIATERADLFSQNTQTRQHTHVLSLLVWSAAAVIIMLLALRFVFMLFGANQNYLFVNVIYTLSTPFAAPFFGLFGYRALYDAPSFEYGTLLALVAYTGAAWGLARLASLDQLHR